VVTSADNSIFRFSAVTNVPTLPVKKRDWGNSSTSTNVALGEFRNSTSPSLRWSDPSYTDGDEGPQAIRVGIDGAVYVLSGDAENIYRYSPNGGSVKKFISGLCESYNFIFGSDGNVYVADSIRCTKRESQHSSSNRDDGYPYEIKKYNGITGEFMGFFTQTVDSSYNQFGWMTAMSFGPDGDLYVACSPDGLYKKRVSNDPPNYAFNIARFNGLTGAFIGYFWLNSLQVGLLTDTHDMIWHVNSTTGAYQLYVGSKDRVVRFDRPIAPTVAASVPESTNWLLSTGSVSLPDLVYAFGMMWYEDALLVVDNQLIQSLPIVENGVTTVAYSTLIHRYEVDAEGNGVQTAPVNYWSVLVNSNCPTANTTGTPTTQCGILCNAEVGAVGTYNYIGTNYWECSNNRWVNRGNKEPWTNGLYHPQYIASLNCDGKKCQGCSGVTGEN